MCALVCVNADGVRCRRSASYVVVGGSNVGDDELDKQRFITVGDGSGGSNSSSNSSNLMMSTSSSNNSLGPNPSSSCDRRSKKVSSVFCTFQFWGGGGGN